MYRKGRVGCCLTQHGELLQGKSSYRAAVSGRLQFNPLSIFQLKIAWNSSLCTSLGMQDLCLHEVYIFVHQQITSRLPRNLLKWKPK